MIFRHFRKKNWIWIQIFRPFRISSWYCILIFIYFSMRNCFCIQIFRIIFKNYLNFNIFFILFISNSRSFNGLIHCFTIWRIYFKIYIWFFKLFFGNTSSFNFFTHCTYCYVLFLYYFCKNWCLCLALCNPWCVNCVIIILTRFQFTDYEPSVE